MSKKNEIKEQIAHLLMRSNVGLLENAIIQQVEATSNVNAITEALKNMKNVSEVMLDGKRWKITPVGRSIYSDLNSEKEPADNTSEDRLKKTEEPVPGIERIDSFRTPDGEIHATKEAAELHMLRQQLLPSIDAFMEHIGSKCKQKGLIRSYITRWEAFKQEQAA
jgi:hypothetical protein